MTIKSINPANGEVLEQYEEWNSKQIDDGIAAANREFRSWSHTSFEHRAAILHSVAGYLREHKAELAAIATLEMGKSVVEAEAEVEKCALGCDFYADHAEGFLRDDPVETNAAQSYVAYEPLGVILCIMPWNFPFWQVYRFAAPALMAGNTVILKHAPNVPQCALAIEKIFRDCGLPHGGFTNILIQNDAAEQLIVDPRIRAVSLTGSSRAGSQVASLSGRYLKKTVLELGGSDPFIVLADADLPDAAATAVRSRYQNTGQSCIAAKRFILVDSIADEFQQRFVEAVSKLRVGDPMQRDTQIGPLARRDLRDNLERQVNLSLQNGAQVLLGGKPISGPGNFYEPTVLTNIVPEMPVMTEETFGPVAPLIRVANEDEAIALANQTQYGLGSNIWTRDIEKGRAYARRIEAGNVFINGMTASDPRLPFGGVKNSGYGRELSVFGIREFVNIQTVWIGPPNNPPSKPVQREVE